MHASHILSCFTLCIYIVYLLAIWHEKGGCFVVVIARPLTQSTSVFKKNELNSYSCVLMSPYNWVAGNQCKLYENVYLSFTMELTREKLLIYVNPMSMCWAKVVLGVL